MKRREMQNALRRERIIYGRISALSGNYLSLYTVDPKTGHFVRYSATSVYGKLGLATEGQESDGEKLIIGISETKE